MVLLNVFIKPYKECPAGILFRCAEADIYLIGKENSRGQIPKQRDIFKSYSKAVGLFLLHIYSC